MQVDIYRPRARRDLYLFVPHGTDVRLFLTDMLAQFGELELVKTREIQPGQSLVGASADEILQNITRAGFHVQGVKVTAEVSEGGAALGGGILGASFAGPVGALFGALLGYALAEHAKRAPDEL